MIGNEKTTTVSAPSETVREWTKSEVVLNAWLDRAAELIEKHVVTPFIGAPGSGRQEAAE